MKRKIWEVTIGNNWSSHKVEAKNYIEAGRKAMKLAQPVPRDEKYVSSVRLICTTQG